MPSAILRSQSDWCVVTACLGLLLPVSSLGSEYDTIYLGPGSARAINNLGQVVGVDSDSGPWFWSFDTGRLSLTEIFGREVIHATDINDNTEITGRVTTRQGVLAFLGKYPEGYVVTLNPHEIGLNPPRTYASSISNSGLVVGSGGEGLVWDRSCADPHRTQDNAIA